jgi:translation initiation factor 4E
MSTEASSDSSKQGTANVAPKSDKTSSKGDSTKSAPAKQSKLSASIAEKANATGQSSNAAPAEKSSGDSTQLSNALGDMSITQSNDTKSSEGVTEAGETVITPDPADQKMYHPLHNKWTMWFTGPAATKGKAREDSTKHWQSAVKKILDFDTVEAFWGLFNNLQPPSLLANKNDYHVFKDGIRPEWEDKANDKGGKWQLEYQNKEDLNRAWTYVVLAMIGEQFEDSDEICGAVVSIRPKRCRLALWTRNSNNEQAQLRIGAGLKKFVEAGNQKIAYQTHDQSKHQGGFDSFKYSI